MWSRGLRDFDASPADGTPCHEIEGRSRRGAGPAVTQVVVGGLVARVVSQAGGWHGTRQRSGGYEGAVGSSGVVGAGSSGPGVKAQARTWNRGKPWPRR